MGSPGSKSFTDGCTEFATKVADCIESPSIESLFFLMDWLQSNIHFEAGVIAMLSGVDETSQSINGVFNHSYDDSWVSIYQKKNYVHVDPVIRAALSCPGPVKWAVPPLDHCRCNSGFFEAARRHGLRQGIAYVSHKPQASVLISVANVKIEQMTARSMELVRAVGAVAAQTLPSSARSVELPYLTSRERDVLRWLCAGKTNYEIATILGVTERTVKFHLENMYEKLQVINRGQAIAKAVRLELL